MSALPALPAPREDPQMLLEAALRELAPAWKIVSWPVSAPDGREEWRVILRHRISGHLKLLGGLGDHDPGGRPRGLAAWVVEAYRLGNREPLGRYLEDVGVATGLREVRHGTRRPSVVTGPVARQERSDVERPADLATDMPRTNVLGAMLRAVRRELTFWRLRTYNHARSQS